MPAGRLLAILLVTGSIGAAAWALTEPRPAFSNDGEEALRENVDPAKGHLIFALGDCGSCHASPGQPDRLRLGGGLALASRYGTFRIPNVSTDLVDGIGAWRTIDLANAILSGVSPSGTHYYPVFPYSDFAKMQIGDVRDLIAYLRTLPAVSGKPPPHEDCSDFGSCCFLIASRSYRTRPAGIPGTAGNTWWRQLRIARSVILPETASVPSSLNNASPAAPTRRRSAISRTSRQNG